MCKAFFLISTVLLFFCCLFAASKKAGDNKADSISTYHKSSFFSSATDRFRSKQIGNWNDVDTWESSPDGITWTNATLVPNSAAGIISILNSHTVTVSTNQNMDQVVIETNGQLNYTGGVLTVEDGTGDDITINNGGVFTLDYANNPPVCAVNATVKITQGGILKVSAGGMTFNGTGINAANYNYMNGGILELTIVYSTDGVTYFPNVAANVIPVFRSSTLLNVGAAGNTTFNGLFEAALSLNLVGSGQKIFRNGITGSGSINGSGSGKFIINGNSATLGGSGLLTVPTVAGLEIGNGSSTNVSLISNKTITNNITLLNKTYVFLNDNNLTMNGTILGGSQTAHVVTAGLGKLVMNNIGITPVTFPIGADIVSWNPLVMANGGGINYGARVEIGISPAIVVPLRAINRTWVIRPSANAPGNVNVNFFYAGTHGNTNFNYTSPVELGFYNTVWNVISTGLTQLPGYKVVADINSFAANTDAPLVIGNHWAILALNDPVTVNYFNGIKQNGRHLLHWKLTYSNTPFVNLALERSIDGGINYTALYTEMVTALRCEQPFTYADNYPVAGINYYRIKMTDVVGKFTYSTVISLTNAGKSFEIISVAPNPVTGGRFTVKISVAKNEQMQLVISDMQGRVVQKNAVLLSSGINNIPVQMSNPVAGTYLLYGLKETERSNIVRFVMQ